LARGQRPHSYQPRATPWERANGFSLQANGLPHISISEICVTHMPQSLSQVIVHIVFSTKAMNRAVGAQYASFRTNSWGFAPGWYELTPLASYGAFNGKCPNSRRRLAVGDAADRAVCVTRAGRAPDPVAQAAQPAVSQVANLRIASKIESLGSPRHFAVYKSAIRYAKRICRFNFGVAVNPIRVPKREG
jgi:hypothetical protein